VQGANQLLYATNTELGNVPLSRVKSGLAVTATLHCLSSLCFRSHHIVDNFIQLRTTTELL
jgi:hypothetical protein